jgi:hypothetical protein
MSEAGDWAAKRREAAQVHAERLERARAEQTGRARRMIEAFATQATQRGVRTRPLLARPGEGPPTYRTGLDGWYLNRDGSLGVTPDGGYYVLVSPRSVRSRFLGVTLQPADPPLQVGAGGRDGESIALDVLLDLRLSAADDWPVAGLDRDG